MGHLRVIKYELDFSYMDYSFFSLNTKKRRRRAARWGRGTNVHLATDVNEIFNLLALSKCLSINYLGQKLTNLKEKFKSHTQHVK